jgi:hypothetical protein
MTATPSGRLWVRARAAGDKESITATLWSATAAAPAIAVFPLFGIDLAGEISGRHFSSVSALSSLLRYWILVGPAFLVWSFVGLPWREQGPEVRLVRASRVVVWGAGSLLSFLALLTS